MKLGPGFGSWISNIFSLRSRALLWPLHKWAAFQLGLDFDTPSNWSSGTHELRVFRLTEQICPVFCCRVKWKNERFDMEIKHKEANTLNMWNDLKTIFPSRSPNHFHYSDFYWLFRLSCINTAFCSENSCRQKIVIKTRRKKILLEQNISTMRYSIYIAGTAIAHVQSAHAKSFLLLTWFFQDQLCCLSLIELPTLLSEICNWGKLQATYHSFSLQGPGA